MYKNSKNVHSNRSMPLRKVAVKTRQIQCSTCDPCDGGIISGTPTVCASSTVSKYEEIDFLSNDTNDSLTIPTTYTRYKPPSQTRNLTYGNDAIRDRGVVAPGPLGRGTIAHR
jgi:hypothetical protein